MGRNVRVCAVVATLAACSGTATAAGEKYRAAEIRGRGVVVAEGRSLYLFEFAVGANDENGRPLTPLERARRVTDRMNRLTAIDPEWRSGPGVVVAKRNGQWVIASGVDRPGLEFVITADTAMATFKGRSARAYADLLLNKLRPGFAGITVSMKVLAKNRAPWRQYRDYAESQYWKGQQELEKAAAEKNPDEKRDRRSDARAHFVTAADADPGYVDAYLAIVDVSKALGRLDAVYDAAVAALPAAREAAGWRAKGEEALLEGKAAAAEDCFRNAVEKQPGCALNYLFLAEACRKQNKPERAAAVLDEARANARGLLDEAGWPEILKNVAEGR